MRDTTRKDFRIDVRVRNANLLRAMEAKGFKSGSDLARAAGISVTEACKFLNVGLSPYRQDGQVRTPVERLCIALECSVEELFSDAQLLPLETNHASVDITAEQAYALTGEVAQIEHDDGLSDALGRALGSLTNREALVLRMRNGIEREPMTLDEISDEFCVSRERIRQIEAKALRKLRHPSRSGELRPFVGYDA